MTDKPNPYVGRPIKWLIPEWLCAKDKYTEVSEESEKVSKQAKELYRKQTQIAEAIRNTVKGTQVFVLKDGRSIIVGSYGVELCPTTELVATVRKDKP